MTTEHREEVSRKEVINLLKKSGVNISEIDEEEIENLRNLSTTINSLGNVKKTSKSRYWSVVKSYFFPIITAWFIWAFLLFTLDSTNIYVFYNDEEWLAWLFLLPLSGVFIFMWVRKFIISDKKT